MAVHNDYTDSDLLHPFEITLEEAARRLFAGLCDPEGLTEADILEGLNRAILAGEMKLKRGTMTEYPWPTHEPILDAIKAGEWLESTGLELDSDGSWSEYLWRETEVQIALDDRLRALRAMEAMEGEKPDEPAPDLTDWQDRHFAMLEENYRLRRELEERHQPEKELTPKSQKTHLRIIAALLEQLKGIEDETDYGIAKTAINLHLARKGRPPMKDQTTANVIKAARVLAAEDSKT